MPRPVLVLILLASLATAGACGPRDPEATASGPVAGPADASAGDGEVAARVEGDVITVDQLDEWIKEDLFLRSTDERDPMKTWAVRRDALNRMIDERLLRAEAERRGVALEELVREEVVARVDVSDADVETFYDENAERIGRELPEVEAQIRQHLERQALPERHEAFVASLRGDREVEIVLDAPRVDVEATGPSRGPEDAPVTIVEFSDYQCPFCRRAEPTIQRVLDEYGDKVRFVYRHYPLDRIHPEARAAAEAAACAEELGGFWPYHEKLFAEGAEFDRDSLVQYAVDVGLDGEAFAACVEERRYQDQIQADLEAGTAAGVSGTPAFFVNGIRLNGARPYEDFVRVIEDELERQGAS